jgi:hypothetical protein
MPGQEEQAPAHDKGRSQSPSVQDWASSDLTGTWMKPAQTEPDPIDSKWRIEIRANGKIQRIAQAQALYSKHMARKKEISLEKKRRLPKPDIFWKARENVGEREAHPICRDVLDTLYKPPSFPFRTPADVSSVVQAVSHLKFFQEISQEQVRRIKAMI